MTRAFQQQGVEIVWAQETSETAAQVYQYNFPDIPLYIGELQKIDISRIPEFDLLLTSIRAPRFSIAQPVRSKMNQYTEMQKCEAEYLEKIIVYRKPKAVCFTLPVNHLILKQEMIEMLQRQGYFCSYKVMDGEQYGDVPFKGRKLYVVGFVGNYESDRFYFPSITPKTSGISQVLDRSQRKEDTYYRLRDEYAKLFSNIKLKDDEIYQVIYPHALDHIKQLSVKTHSSCPVLTNGSSRERDLSLNNEIIDFGDPAENFFRSRVLPHEFTDSREVQGNVAEYFASFDEAIQDFKVEELPPEDEKDTSKRYTIDALHRKVGSQEMASIPLKQESSGTLKMFALYPSLKDVLDNGLECSAYFYYPRYLAV